MDEGEQAEDGGAAEIGEDHHPLARPAVDQRADDDPEDHARDELAEEEDAHPPGRVRLVEERNPDGEERGPGSERGDEAGEEKIAVPAVFGHTYDRELRGELPQHPGRAYNLRGTASAVRNGRARAVEWRRWPAARGLTTNSSPACERATGGPWRGRSRSSRAGTPRPGAASGAVSGDRLVVRGRGHRAARRRQVVADRRADQARSRARPHGRRDLDRSFEPVHHGALLGDRIRLSEHFLDPGVFIRSMGARGHLGGLAETTLQSLLLLDAAGTDVVFLETVGAGQSEVEVMSVADEIVLVLMPGSGDSVQALKAGIMEIPDVIAVNKMDQPGAKALQNDIRGVIALDPDAAWRPPIVLTEALRGEGIDRLWSAITERRDALAADGELERRRSGNLAGEVVAAATARARAAIEHAIAEDASLAELIASVQRREVDPLTAADRVASAVLREATP